MTTQLEHAEACRHKGDGITSPHIAVSDLGFQRDGRWLFQHMNWQIPRGKFVALAGPSGVGKTTLLFCLAGLLQPTTGRITFRCMGGCQHDPDDFQRKTGLVYQDLRLVANSSLLNNVLCGRLGFMPWWRTLLMGFPQRDKNRAYELLGSLGIAQYTHTWAGAVSGGERQRAAVARAIFQDPEVYLADEPVAHLDPDNARRVLGLFKKEALERGKTVFCALHDSRLVDEFADYALTMNYCGQWRLTEPRKAAAALE